MKPTRVCQHHLSTHSWRACYITTYYRSLHKSQVSHLMSSPAVAVFRGNKYYFHTQFQPHVPWTPIQLKGQYEIQSMFYEITTSAIQVRILTREDQEALVLFPIHFGPKEYAYLFFLFKQYILQHTAVLKDKAFDDLV